MVLHRYVDWGEELGRFVESRVREYEQRRVIEELEGIIRELPLSPRGTAARYVREDRDSP